MTRLKHWPSRFAALVASARLEPFAWGSHDCCLWAADSVLALTGVDPAHALRGTYGDERSALKLVARLGGLTAIGLMCGPEIKPAHATDGDVGLVAWPDGVVSLGVHGGTRWMCVGDAGLVDLPLSAASLVWGVGRA